MQARSWRSEWQEWSAWGLGWGQGRGAATLDTNREILEAQGGGLLTNVRSEPGEKTLGKPGVGK